MKATVVLLPLFGLHWLLTLYRPQSGHCIWLTFYKYVNVALDGLQGLMVAIAFCYRNAEVRLSPGPAFLKILFFSPLNSCRPSAIVVSFSSTLYYKTYNFLVGAERAKNCTKLQTRSATRRVDTAF